MADKEESSNPAQKMRDKTTAAADTALAKKAAADERRAASKAQTASDVKDFTPDDESIEVEGVAAPKYFKGGGGFEYLHDPETGAFTITNAPGNYAHLKGKNVTSGKAYDSIMAEMKTGKSLYQKAAPETEAAPAPAEEPRYGVPDYGESPRDLEEGPIQTVPDLRESPNPDLRTSPNPDLRESPNPDLRTSPNPDMRTSPNPDTRTSFVPDMRTSPNPDMRTSPNPDLGESFNPDMRTSPNPNLGESFDPYEGRDFSSEWGGGVDSPRNIDNPYGGSGFALSKF